MFDNEVKFRQVMEYEPRETRTRLESLLEGISILGGGALGFLAGKYLLGTGTFVNLFIFTPMGAGTLYSPVSSIVNSLKKKDEKRFLEQEVAKYNEALANGAPSAKFVYRSHKLECVIRPDYKDGHVFDMASNDKVIPEFIFDYDPHRASPLAFTFSFQDFKHEPKPARQKKGKDELEIMIDSINSQIRSQIQQKLKTLKMTTPKDEDLDNCTEYQGVIRALAEKAGPEYNALFEHDGKRLCTQIAYSGKSPIDDLQRFADLTNQALSSAYSFRSTHE